MTPRGMGWVGANEGSRCEGEEKVWADDGLKSLDAELGSGDGGVVKG